MSTTVLITGTGAGVGKTWVGRALGRALSIAGVRVVAIKPVETGASDARALDEDGALLAAATGQTEPSAALYRLQEPVDPAFAGEAGGEALDLDAMLMRIEALGAGADVVLVEGTGGLLTPLTWEWNAVDLARSLNASAIVVGPDHVGTINHTLLTLGAIELAGLSLCGVALTPPRQDDVSTGANAQAIARLTGIDRILTLPRRADPAALTADVQPIIAWMRATAP